MSEQVNQCFDFPPPACQATIDLLFLLTASQTRPNVNFLGIEILRKYQLYTATRLAKRGIGNVRLLLGDARLIFHHCVPAASVQAIHVYFPDPWWKSRHHKRRLFTADFAVDCARILQPGGQLRIGTDVEAYFHTMTELLAQHTPLLLLPPSPPRQAAHDLDYLTNFDRKFRLEGRAIYHSIYQRSDP